MFTGFVTYGAVLCDVWLTRCTVTSDLTNARFQWNTLWAELWSRELTQRWFRAAQVRERVWVLMSVCVCVSWHYIRGKIQLKSVRGQNIPQRWWRSRTTSTDDWKRLWTSTCREPSQVWFISVVLYTVQTDSEQLHCNKQENKSLRTVCNHSHIQWPTAATVIYCRHTLIMFELI